MTDGISKERRILTEEDLVSQYFKLVTNKDVDNLLNMFAHDAVVYEPFSKSEEGLRGRSAIEPFLKVVMMANDRLVHNIVIEKKQRSGNNVQVVALVTFEKGDKVKGRFTFEFDPDYGDSLDHEGRIKTLHIQFI